MQDKRIEILRDMDTSKAIMKLAIPAIVGFMVMAIYNVADTMFVSWASPKGAGAIQVVFPIMMIASSIGLMFGIGGGSYVSRLLGQNNKNKANSVVTTALFTSLFIGAIYVILGIYKLESIVKIFGAKGEMIALSVNYGFYIVIGAIFVIPSMVFNNALRAEGSSKYSMIGMGLGALINIAIDPLFIFGLHMGIKGAALATMISQAISCTISYQFYIRNKTVLDIHFKYFKFDIDIYLEVLKIGLPTFFRQMLFSVSMALLNNASSIVGGDYLLSAMGIAIKSTSMIGFFIFGMGQGLQPVVGYNYGADNLNRVLSAQRHGMRKTFVGALIGSVIFMIFAKQIICAFTSEIEVIHYAVPAIRALSAAMIFMAVSNTITVIFQALGNGKVSMFFSVLRQGILLIPAIVLLSKYFASIGVMYAQCLADVVAFLVSMVIYIILMKRDIKKNMGREIKLLDLF